MFALLALGFPSPPQQNCLGWPLTITRRLIMQKASSHRLHSKPNFNHRGSEPQRGKRNSSLLYHLACGKSLGLNPPDKRSQFCPSLCSVSQWFAPLQDSEWSRLLHIVGIWF